MTRVTRVLRHTTLWALCVMGVLSQLTVATLAQPSQEEPIWRLRQVEEISDVWNGVTVGFAFLVRPDAVYVGYYTYDRSMTIARYSFESKTWEFKTLDTKIGWDSHNSIAMAFDANDCLHVAGNMHAVPLIYFSAEEPNDISTLTRREKMVGDLEQHATYPVFMYDAQNRLLFGYRDGGSGNGNQIWNVYDPQTRAWSRLLDKPLFDGQGLMNAYPVGPTRSADGFFHIAWVWRDTPDCKTNHDLSYARSKDLRVWETSDGKELTLPITLQTGEIVSATPIDHGLLNSHVRLNFDRENRPVIVYTLYDDQGRLQIWTARREAERWRYTQATHWDLNWHFSGGGSIDSELSFSGASVAPEGKLSISWTRYDNNTHGVIYLDEKTMEPCEAPKVEKPRRPEYDAEAAAALAKVDSSDARLHSVSRTIDVKGERWVFRWEAPRPNRDRPQPDGAPEPTKLRVFKFEKK